MAHFELAKNALNLQQKRFRLDIRDLFLWQDWWSGAVEIQQSKSINKELTAFINACNECR